jgi:hypothetical protein
VLSFKKHCIKMSNKLSTRAGNIREFEVFQANGGKSIDASPGVVDIKYYEDILSNTVSLSAIITESGESYMLIELGMLLLVHKRMFIV